MAGASAERQENGVVKAVNDAVKKNKNGPVTVDAGGTKITNVNNAKKYTGRQASGSEPYTDVIFEKKNGKAVNLSLKGEAAPSLAGGGLRGLEAIVPGLAGRFMKAAYDALIAQGLKAGDKVPDVYGKIGPKTKEKIVVGTQAMGGPIDYMYIGPMTVVGPYDTKTNTVNLNGTLTESKEYAKTHELYFRLRARREDQRFDPNAEQGGVPKIYGRSPSRGDSAGRIVVTDSIPKNAMVVPVK
jgi:hypothetical protein